MSRKLLAFLLSELETVRIICKNGVCGAITEIPIKKLADVFHKYQCPACGRSFMPEAGTPKITGDEASRNWLETLARTISGLQAVSGHVDVEFIIKDRE